MQSKTEEIEKTLSRTLGKSTWILLYHFMREPNETLFYNRGELSQRTGLSRPTLNNAIDALAALGVVEKRMIGKNKVAILKEENETTEMMIKLLKKAINAKKLPDSIAELAQ